MKNNYYNIGIWAVIERFENKMKKYDLVSKGTIHTIYAIFKPFSKGKIFCPFFISADILIFIIDKIITLTEEYGNPKYSIKEEDSDNKNNRLLYYQN